MKRYIFITATLMLSACAPTAHQENATVQKTAAVAVDTETTGHATQTDRITREDEVIGSVLGGLSGAFLDADRDDRIHASAARYHRSDCNQGNTYFDKARHAGDLEERIDFMQQGIRYCPDNPAAHNDLGLGLMLWGDLTAARTHFAQALRLDPDYNPARINLSRIQYSHHPEQKTGQGSTGGSAGKNGGNTVQHGGLERLIRHNRNSEEHLERRKRWDERQKKLIEQNGGYD